MNDTLNADNGIDDDFSGLSDEERAQLAAMADVDEDAGDSDKAEMLDEAEAHGEEGDPSAAVDPEVVLEAESESDAPAAQEADVLPQAPMPVEPVFQAAVPEGAVERIKAIEQEQQALALALQDGDIDMGEFFAKNNALNNESIKLNIALEQANFAQQQNENLRAARWKWTEEQFMSNQANQIYRDNPIALDALNAAIRRVSADPKNAGKPDEWYLQEADNAVRIAFNLQPTQRTAPAPAKVEKNRKPDLSGIPPSLGSMPAADSNSVGEFAYLDKLSGIDLEIAINKLTPEQQDRYLSEV